jgi:integral membrane protein (TIGR01906 family)
LKALNLLISIALIIIIIFAPLFLLMNNFLLTYEFNKQSIRETSNMTKDEYLFYTDQVIKYFFNNESNLNIKDKNGNNLNNFFTEEEILHMIDVKRIIRYVFILLIISLVTLFALFKKIKFKIVSNALILSFVALSIIGTILYFNFDRSFYIFHKIFFRNQYWLLPENDMLIRMFPENFFYDYAITWFVISCFPGFILILLKIFGHLKNSS